MFKKAHMKTTVSFCSWLLLVWTAAWRRTFGRLSNASRALENQEWPVHTATYLPKWSWRLINTCNPFLCRVSKWDFKSCAKPHASRSVRDSSGGEEKQEREITYQSPPEADVIFRHMHWIVPVMCPFESCGGLSYSLFSFCDCVPHCYNTQFSSEVSCFCLQYACRKGKKCICFVLVI